MQVIDHHVGDEDGDAEVAGINAKYDEEEKEYRNICCISKTGNICILVDHDGEQENCHRGKLPQSKCDVDEDEDKDGNAAGTAALKYALHSKNWEKILFLTMKLITTLGTQHCGPFYHNVKIVPLTNYMTCSIYQLLY